LDNVSDKLDVEEHWFKGGLAVAGEEKLLEGVNGVTDKVPSTDGMVGENCEVLNSPDGINGSIGTVGEVENI
jgi:hypothetical protein